MLKRTSLAAWMAATLCLALAGCAMEMGDESAYELDPEGDIGASTEGLVARVRRRVHRHVGAPVDLGSTSDRTCFITGINGFLVGSYVNGNWREASVDVYVEDGRWYASTHAGADHTGATYPVPPEVSVACVNVPYEATQHMYWDNAGTATTTNAVPWQSNRSCFLSRVAATNGLSLASPGNRHVEITEEYIGSQLYFTLNGSFSPPIGGGPPPNVWAEAVCIDFPSFGQWDYGWGAGTNASNTVIASDYVRQSYPSGAILGANDYQCGLTEVGGNHLLISPDPFVQYNQTSVSTRDIFGNPTDHWRLTATNGRWFSARCVRANRPVRGG